MGSYTSDNAKASATNGTATATLAAVAGKRYNDFNLTAGFSATPGAGATLTLNFGATAKLVLPVVAAGPIPMPNLSAYCTAANTAVTAVLTTGGSGVVGYVNLAAKVI